MQRNPRLRVLANGEILEGAIEAWVSSTSAAAADSFGLIVAVGGNALSIAPAWVSQSNITVDIGVSLDGGLSFVGLIFGNVDTVVVEPFQGVITLEGRNLVALLSSSNTQEAFLNQTASEVVTNIAERHGLNPVVTLTSGLVGGFDTNGRNLLTLNQSSKILSDWDLLVALAGHEQFDLFVIGSTLYFQPAGQTEQNTCVLTPADLIDLRMERALPLASGVEVTVKSWNHWLQQAIITTATGAVVDVDSQATVSSSSYQLIRPNLLAADADLLAQQQLAEIQLHELVVEFDMPGEAALTARDLIALTGTGSVFDQIYNIESIDRRISSATGFVEHIRAKCGSSPTS